MHARGALALGKLVDPKQLLVAPGLLSLLFDLIYFLEMVQIQKMILEILQATSAWIFGDSILTKVTASSE